MKVDSIYFPSDEQLRKALGIVGLELNDHYVDPTGEGFPTNDRGQVLNVGYMGGGGTVFLYNADQPQIHALHDQLIEKSASLGGTPHYVDSD
ncbi:MAG: hypothetical protein ABIJ92_04970 [Candidatus Aenigmatarchaeota archaeon]